MMDNSDDIDFESLKEILGVEQVASLWAKAEIAKILMKRSSELMQEIHTELKFYMITNGIEEK